MIPIYPTPIQLAQLQLAAQSASSTVLTTVPGQSSVGVLGPMVQGIVDDAQVQSRMPNTIAPMLLSTEGALRVVTVPDEEEAIWDRSMTWYWPTSEAWGGEVRYAGVTRDAGWE